jgi:hypothetical protein
MLDQRRCLVGRGYLTYNDIDYLLILEFRRDFDSVRNGSSNLRRTKRLLCINTILLAYGIHHTRCSGFSIYADRVAIQVFGNPFIQMLQGWVIRLRSRYFDM